MYMTKALMRTAVQLYSNCRVWCKPWRMHVQVHSDMLLDTSYLDVRIWSMNFTSIGSEQCGHESGCAGLQAAM